MWVREKCDEKRWTEFVRFVRAVSRPLLRKEHAGVRYSLCCLRQEIKSLGRAPRPIAQRRADSKVVSGIGIYRQPTRIVFQLEPRITSFSRQSGCWLLESLQARYTGTIVKAGLKRRALFADSL
jgi:hypothetical protein